MPRQIFPVQIPRHAGLQRLQHTLRGLVPPDAHTRAALRGHSVGAAPQVFSRTAVFALQLSAAQRAAAFARQRVPPAFPALLRSPLRQLPLNGLPCFRVDDRRMGSLHHGPALGRQAAQSLAFVADFLVDMLHSGSCVHLLFQDAQHRGIAPKLCQRGGAAPVESRVVLLFVCAGIRHLFPVELCRNA